MKIAALQICSVLDYKVNLEKIRRMILEAGKQGARHIFLPEVFYSMSDGLGPTPHLVQEGNEHYENIRALARDHKVYVLGGSAATSLQGKIMNRAFNFGPDGKDLGHYDKRKLFSCELDREGQKKVLDEGKTYSPGFESKMISAPPFKLGLSICFDLRFPHFYQDYVQQGANLLSISSAFTVPTGKAHWHILVRARAIETQSFVVACGQWGKHNERMQTYGHSLIVNPWGEVLTDAGEGEKVIVADIDLDQVEITRKAVKVFV